LAFVIWLLVVDRRYRKDAREIVHLEVATCILKTD
jgi:hypothetical protein